MSVLADKISNLKPGQSFALNLNKNILDEKLNSTHEGNLVEHYVMYHLANSIKNGKKLALRGEPEDFLKSKNFIKLNSDATPEQQQRCLTQGNAIANRIYSDILSDPNLLSLEAYITPQDIQNRGSADLVIRFYRDTQSDLIKMLRISLKKAQKKGATPMGMKVLIAFLSDTASKIAQTLNVELDKSKDEIGAIKKLITDPDILRKLQFMTDAKRISTFFSNREIPSSERMNHKIFRDFIDSPFYQNDTSMAKRGYDKKIFFTDRSLKVIRSAPWSNFLISQGYSKETLQSYGADVFNHIIQNVLDKPGVVEVLREKIKWMIGFDDVEIYKVLPQGGTVDVKYFNETDGYKKIMDAINNSSDIRFRRNNETSQRTYVDVYVLGKVVASFAFGINYLAGEFQINIDYDQLKAGNIIAK